jgi:hypothetical protein
MSDGITCLPNMQESKPVSGVYAATKFITTLRLLGTLWDEPMVRPATNRITMKSDLAYGS